MKFKVEYDKDGKPVSIHKGIVDLESINSIPMPTNEEWQNIHSILDPMTNIAVIIILICIILVAIHWVWF